MLALDLGCRRGELTGPTWKDIDFEARKVEINKTTQYAYGKIFEEGTKIEHSKRVNYISDSTVQILKKYQKEQLNFLALSGKVVKECLLLNMVLIFTLIHQPKF